MAEARKAFKLATLEREELELMNDISNHENQLLTALNDDQRKELKLALKIARLVIKLTLKMPQLKKRKDVKNNT
jgi:hypothetical protein